MEKTVDAFANGHELPTDDDDDEREVRGGSQVARADYDPYEHGKTRHGTSFWGAVFHLVIVSAGPAILSIPIMFVAVGNVVGFFLTFATVAFYAHNLNTMVWSEYQLCKLERAPNFTYSELVYRAFKGGPSGIRWFAVYCRYLVDVMFVANWFGATCYNFVLIGENLRTAYDNMYGVRVDLRYALSLVFVPLLLLTWIRQLRHLVPISVVGNVLNVISLLFVVYNAFADPSPWHVAENFGSPENLPLFLGTVLFSVNATGFVMPLKNEMKYPKKFGSTFGVLNVSYAIASVLYACFSLLCGLKYGKTLRNSVIENLPDDQPLAQVIVVLSTLALMFQYPLFMYVAFDTIWNHIAKKGGQKTMAYPLFGEYVTRTVLVILSFWTAYVVPDVSLFLSFSGTVGTSVDSVIFPAVIHALVLWRMSRKGQPRYRWMLLKNAILVTVGLILVVVGVNDCLKELSSQ